MTKVMISGMAGPNIIFMDIILEVYKTRIWQIDLLPLKRLQCSESLASNEPVAALTQQLLVPVLLVLLPVPLPVLLLLLLLLLLPELALVLLPVPVLPLPVPKITCISKLQMSGISCVYCMNCVICVQGVFLLNL